MGEIEKFASESVIRLLVGNKCDAMDRRKVTIEEAKDLAAHYNVQYIETSAKADQGVVDAFQRLSHEIKAKVIPKKKTASPTSGTSAPKKLTVGKSRQLKSGCC